MLHVTRFAITLLMCVILAPPCAATSHAPRRSLTEAQSLELAAAQERLEAFRSSVNSATPAEIREAVEDAADWAHPESPSYISGLAREFVLFASEQPRWRAALTESDPGLQLLRDVRPLNQTSNRFEPRHRAAYTIVRQSPLPAAEKSAWAAAIILEQRSHVFADRQLVRMLVQADVQHLRDHVYGALEFDPTHVSLGAVAALAHLGDAKTLPAIAALKQLDQESVLQFFATTYNVSAEELAANPRGPMLRWSRQLDRAATRIRMQSSHATLLEFIATSAPVDENSAEAVWHVRRALELDVNRDELAKACVALVRRAKRTGRRGGADWLASHAVYHGALTEAALPRGVKVTTYQDVQDQLRAARSRRAAFQD